MIVGIVFGVIGGLVLIAALVLGVVIYLKKKN